MGIGDWGLGDKVDKVDFYCHAPCPMPHALCPMPYAPCPMPYAPTLLTSS
ncbi:histidine kinase [Nostoc sp. CMAA1605]|nr:histidine kinase [Nostoc sp. CMAA1605]